MIVLPHGLGHKRSITLTADQMSWLMEAEDVCRELQITLACPRCLASGMTADAVLRGNNDPGDPTLSVTCSCRRMVFSLRSDVS